MQNNKIIKIFVTSLITLFAVIGGANAAGIYYYDSINNQIVFNANLNLGGGALGNLRLKTLNSDRNPLSISSLQDIQFRFGRTVPNAIFGINNNANSRVFQLNGDGTMQIGSSLDATPSLKFSIDKDGNFNPTGPAVFAGGFGASGNLINSNKLNEVIRLNADNAMISVPSQKLGFGATVDSFYYANFVGTPFYALTLSRSGELRPLTSAAANNFCLNSSCISSWSAAIDTSTLATSTEVNTAVNSRTKSFGGMYSFSIDIPVDGFYFEQSNLTFIADPYPSDYPANQTTYNFSCAAGNPLSSNNCSCPSGYSRKQVFVRTLSDNSGSTYRAECAKHQDPDLGYATIIDSCPRHYIFLCTK